MLSNEFKSMLYEPKSFPFKSIFYHAFYSTMRYSDLFIKFDKSTNLFQTYVNNRADYVWSIAECAAFIDPVDSNVVYSFLFFRRSTKKVIYFVYTKDKFRNLGLAKGLFDLIGVRNEQDCLVSYIGGVPKVIENKQLLSYSSYFQ